MIESVNQNIMERYLTTGKEGADNINEQSMESGDMLIMEGHQASGQEESDIEQRKRENDEMNVDGELKIMERHPAMGQGGVE